MDSKFMEGCLIFIMTLLVGLLLSLVFAYFVMLLWNWLMPVIFGLPLISFWQAFGLGVLIKLLLPTPSSSSSNK